MLGEVIASKPAWKRRRASENDDELLQMLAEGIGNWIQASGQGEQRGRGAVSRKQKAAGRTLQIEHRCGMRNRHLRFRQ